MTVREILAKLVSFPVLGGESNLSILEWIKEYLSSHGVEYTLVPNEEGNKASLHCRLGPAVDGGIILSGHMDVVPVKGQTWTSDPFTLTERDGKLYARGSCDMKGFVACCLACVPQMLEANLKKPIYFAFSYDEEVGCLAAEELAEHIKMTYEEKPAYCLVGEPSMMLPVTGQKGIVIYKTIVNGSAGHSSRIKQEVSAIHEGARLVLWLENKMDDLIERGQIDERFNPPHTSIHCGVSKRSGAAPNVISDRFEFYWDVRVIPKDIAGDIRDEFEQHCRETETKLRERFPDFKIETEEFHKDVLPLDTANDKSIVALIKQFCQNEKLDAVSYAAEAGFFSAAGFESVICGPGDIAQAHRADEFVSIDQLNQGHEMILRIVDHFKI